MADTQRLVRLLEPTTAVKVMDIPENDSVKDIERYITSRVESLPVGRVAILRKSNASFLWVRMVMDELENVYSAESITHVLRDIPSGMVPYYERIVKAMGENKLEKHITVAVLTWVVGSSRRITLSELSQALTLDINTVLPNPKSAIEGLCGQLVKIHSSGTVDLVHATAREFLLRPTAGEFIISTPVAHKRIAMACLKLFSSREMQPPRNHRLMPQPRPRAEPSPLLDYAITQLFEHVHGASIETDELLLALDRFFKTNVLSWVERLAGKGDLDCLVQASRNLKSYLDRRVKHSSPLSDPENNLAKWSTDLSRLVTKFGEALL
ncbi:hypothetical protein IMZ48_07780, partial [Candidatus Bathyarchaeota archaeon]|nr:hypothetical protein [Candidatus Bathyarchaeota archaeon]